MTSTIETSLAWTGKHEGRYRGVDYSAHCGEDGQLYGLIPAIDATVYGSDVRELMRNIRRKITTIKILKG